jgi:hypothetical protein
VARVLIAGDVRVYLVSYIFYIIDYHICRDIFDRIDIMYCRLPYVSRGVLPLKTPAPLYIYTSIKQYNHLTFDGTPLSNSLTQLITTYQHANVREKKDDRKVLQPALQTATSSAFHWQAHICAYPEVTFLCHLSKHLRAVSAY